MIITQAIISLCLCSWATVVDVASWLVALSAMQCTLFYTTQVERITISLLLLIARKREEERGWYRKLQHLSVISTQMGDYVTLQIVIYQKQERELTQRIKINIYSL